MFMGHIFKKNYIKYKYYENATKLIHITTTLPHYLML